MSAWDELMDELRQYEISTSVCLTHMRFVPCRKGNREGGCVFSEDPDDIQAVHDYQSGK